MNFLSLFAGIGGIDLGLERAGMRCVAQVEASAARRRTLDRHWPNVPRHDDVRTFDARGLRGSIDLVAGGFPCQPFSSASRGKRRGTADDRWLWPEMCRVISECEPAWVFGENVTHLDGPALEQVVSDLEGLGYEVAPPLEVPACAFGHDHRRSRLWLLGYADRDRKSGVPVDAEVAGLPRARGFTGSVGAANGISSRMDRLEGLGNAVVPDIAEWIGREIAAAEGRAVA